MTSGNYVYDEIGELTQDASEEIASMLWRRGDKKLQSITRTTGSLLPDLDFVYNPFGIRVLKVEKTKDDSGNLNPQDQWKYTYYAHDANGQCMAVYDVNMSTSNNQAFIAEHHLYGSSRIGMLKENELIYDNGNQLPTEDDILENTLGLRRYELTNHLGNVQAVITDRKIPAEAEAVDFANIVNNAVCGTPGTWNFDGTGPVVTTNIADFDNDGDVDLDMSHPSATQYSGVLNIATTVGQTYTINYDIDAINASFLNVLGTECPSPITFPLNEVHTTTGSYSATFTATAPLMRLTFFIGNTGGGASNVTLSNLTLDGPGEILGGSAALTCYEAVVVMTSDYYPYGMQMPDRQTQSESYRYQFNGMEADPEVSGEGNSYTTQFRQYDPRLGRWKSLDPLMGIFPSMSPYAGFANNPILFTDPYGLAPTNGDDPPAKGTEKTNPKTGTVYTADGEGGWIQNVEEASVVGAKPPSLKSDAEAMAGEIINNAGSAGAVIANNEKYLSDYDHRLFYSDPNTLQPDFNSPTPLGKEVEKILLKQDYLETWNKEKATMLQEMSVAAQSTTELEAVNAVREAEHSALKSSFMR